MPFQIGDPRHAKELAQFDPAYLPAEIFSKVISIALQPTNDVHTHMFPLALASVNRSWRAFVLDSPHVWASLCVDLSSPTPMNGVQLFLERSRSFPLDIVLYSPDTVDQAEISGPNEGLLIATLMHALNPQQGRWRSFKLHMSTNLALRIAISNFRGVAESLEELILESRHRLNRSDIFQLNTHTPDFSMAMPTIRHLSTPSWVISETNWVTKVQGLISFTLTGPERDVGRAIFPTFLRDIDISIESTLEVLELNGGKCQVLYSTRRPRNPPTSRLQLPRLKEIQFTDCSSDFVDEITPYLEAPNLEILGFFARPDPSEGHFMRMIPHPSTRVIKQFPNLRTFRLMGPRKAGVYVELIDSCEHLVVSGIRDIAGTLDYYLGAFLQDITNPQALWRANHPPPVRWYCPHLLSLEIYHCDGLNPARLRKALESRKDVASLGSPVNAISSLIVHDKRELSGDDRAWFDANLVAFEWMKSDQPSSLAFPTTSTTPTGSSKLA